MSSEQFTSVRLVIQVVRHGAKSRYHVVVYPGPKGVPLHANFSSREGLLERLRAAIPGFADQRVAESGETDQIIFAESLELSDAQLASLGLLS